MLYSGGGQLRTQKRQRQSELQSLLDYYPFLTDQELAKKFAVSIQTIRLDRMELGIPELRERVKMVANDAYAKIKSLGEKELVGNLQEFELGVRGISSLDVGMELVYDKTMTVRAEHIFAQANSLALLTANASKGMTVKVSMEFLRPVYAGERLICKAKVTATSDQWIEAEIITSSAKGEVFTGKFLIKILEG